MDGSGDQTSCGVGAQLYGADQGLGTVTAPRLYQLVRQRTLIGDHRFEIEFLDPGVEAYAFTFG